MAFRQAFGIAHHSLLKFFNRVNRDRLMARVAKRVSDKRLLILIRALPNGGVMESGSSSPTDEGTLQGGPLSPVLPNLVLDELDGKLEKRAHRFVRYPKAAKRVGPPLPENRMRHRAERELPTRG